MQNGILYRYTCVTRENTLPYDFYYALRANALLYVHRSIIAVVKFIQSNIYSVRRGALNRTKQNESPLDEYGPWDAPAILLVDLDAFFASVEQLDHPAWRGKPVIVGGDADKHGVVSTASYEARKFGVHSAMPASMARKLCPNAIWTRGHFDRYREVSSQVMSILQDESPHLQQVSIDEAFLDVSPTPLNREHPVAIAQRIQQRVAMLGVTCSIGVGTSKTIAKIASDMDKPRGLTVVYPGREADFLAPLPIRRMSGVGARAEEALLKRGIKTLGDMAHAPEGLLRSIYGKNADMMRRRCLGLDMTAVEQDDDVKSVSNEITMATDLTTFEQVAAAVDTMAAKVGRRLRRKGLQGRTLGLKMRFADRSTRNLQKRLDGPQDNEHVFIPLLHDMIREIWRPGMAVRLVGVSVTGFQEEAYVQETLFDSAAFVSSNPPSTAAEQHTLFDEGDISGSAESGAKPRKPQDLASNESAHYPLDAEQGKHLAAATDKVKDRFGEAAVFFGREFKVRDKTTGTAAKNPEDYRR